MDKYIEHLNFFGVDANCVADNWRARLWLYGSNRGRRVYRYVVQHICVCTCPPNRLEVAVQGTLKATDGAPSAKTEVVLTENGVKHRTFTNAKGEYVFFGHLTGPAMVEAKGMTQILPQPQPSRTLNLELR
jgi:hypothetical protein